MTESNKGGAGRAHPLGTSDHDAVEIDLPITNCHGDRQQVAPYLALLLRAACLFHLVEEGQYTSVEAIDRLTPAWSALCCGCERQTLRVFEKYDRELRERRFREWRWRR